MYNRLDSYTEVLEHLENALGELSRIDEYYGLTDLQGRSVIALRSIYDDMIGDQLDMEADLNLELEAKFLGMID